MKSKKDRWLLQQLKGCTFDDFLIFPGWGVAKTRKDIDLSTRFSKNIKLNNPLVAANMDTVTEARQAIAFAKEGGIGIIHRYLSIDDECTQVREVKREENFIIENPYSIGSQSPIFEAEELMNRHGVSCLMVLDDSGRLEGIFSIRDLRFCDDKTKPVLTRMNGRGALIIAPNGISCEEARKYLDRNRLEKLPLVDDDMKLAGLITSKDIENLDNFPLANKDSNGQLTVGAAIGATGDYIERAAELLKAGVNVIVLDIANAQSEIGLDAANKFRKNFPNAELVIGNIAIPDAINRYRGMRDWDDLNVNGWKVGLGPGSACTTRYHTNIGAPQAYAIYNCARISRVPVIADGGIRRHGHVFLALMLGASSVMIGGGFAGTDEAPGQVIRNSKSQRVKKFRGMASREAMLSKLLVEHAEDPYETSSRISPEGIEKEIEYRGSVVPIIHEILSHFASSISYIGAKSLQEAQQIFMENPSRYLQKISHAAQIESWQREI